MTDDRHLTMRDVLLDLRDRFGLRTLVETGTGVGGLLAHVADDFDIIHSIEIDPDSYDQARGLVGDRPHVVLHLGDSERLLPEILTRLNRPAVVLLDAHWSGGTKVRALKDTPIREELDAVLNDRHNHALVVDDAVGFDGDPAYPKLAEVIEWMVSRRTYIVELMLVAEPA